jgi:hypothetical protein
MSFWRHVGPRHTDKKEKEIKNLKYQTQIRKHNTLLRLKNHNLMIKEDIY